MLDVQRDSGVVRLFLDRPGKANALDSELLERLADTLESLRGEAELHALDETTARAFIGLALRAAAAVSYNWLTSWRAP